MRHNAPSDTKTLKDSYHGQTGQLSILFTGFYRYSLHVLGVLMVSYLITEVRLKSVRTRIR